MTKAELQAENNELLDILEQVRDRLQQLEEIVREALDDESDEEE